MFQYEVDLRRFLNGVNEASWSFQTLTNDLGTFPLVKTFWLCFSLATRILCLAGILEEGVLISRKLLRSLVDLNHNKASL